MGQSGPPSSSTISADSDSRSLFAHTLCAGQCLFFTTHFFVEPASVQTCRWVPFNVMNYRQRPPRSLHPVQPCAPDPTQTHCPRFIFGNLLWLLSLWIQSGCSRHWRLFILTWIKRCFHWVIKEMKTSHKIEGEKSNKSGRLMKTMRVFVDYTRKYHAVFLYSHWAQGQMHGHTSHFTPPIFTASLADLRWKMMDFFQSSVFSAFCSSAWKIKRNY